MAWLVRAAGIPSRVAFGYSRGTRSGDTWTLSNRNLHAWTEVYFDKFGWVPFDATPASFVSGVDSAWAPDPNKVDSAPGGSVSGGNVPGGPPTGPGASPGANGNLPNERADNPSGALNGGTGSPTWPLWTLVAILVLLALLAAPGIWRYRLRRRRWPSVSAGPKPVPVTVAPGSPEMVVTDDGTHGRARQRAHAAWDELVDTLTDHRMSVDVSATPRMTAERVITVASLTGGSATGARTLGHAEERARYARTPLDDDDLAGALRDVRTAIAGRVSWQTRVRALLMPPSVVERWRAAAGQVIGRWTDAVIRWRARVAAVASPTRFLRRRTS